MALIICLSIFGYWSYCFVFLHLHSNFNINLGLNGIVAIEIWFKAILQVVLIFSYVHNIERGCIIIYEMAMTSTL